MAAEAPEEREDAAALERARGVVAALTAMGQPVTVERVRALAHVRTAVAARAAREARGAGPEEGPGPAAPALALGDTHGAPEDAPDPLPFAAAPQEDPLPWGEAEETARAAALRSLAWRRRALRAAPWVAMAAAAAAAAPHWRWAWRAVTRAWSAPAAAAPPGPLWVAPANPWAWVPRVDGLPPRTEALILAGLALAMLPPGNRLLRGVYLGALLALAAVAWHLLAPLLGTAQQALGL